VSGPFDGKRVLLGVSGSIAAYKAIDIASKLTQAGAIVNVLMSPAATHFVTPLTFRSMTHQDVVTDLFDLQSRQAIEHVALAKDADILVVAPATAHTIAKLALGLADDPITVTALATSAPTCGTTPQCAPMQTYWSAVARPSLAPAKAGLPQASWAGVG
jgi:phosphopantothenoylcysteine decarboxylase/phosphopantothenate--cysteine ligase